MLSETSYELIEKYLDKTLSAEEQPLFDAALEDKAFRDQLAFQAHLIDLLTDEEKTKLHESIKSSSTSVKKLVSDSKKKKRSLWPMGIAAGLALCLAAFFVMKMFNTISTEQIYVDHFRPYPPAVIERGQGEYLPTVFKNAMKAYVNEDYSTALPLFEEMGTENEKILIYKAMSLMKLDNDNEAKALLSNLARSTEPSIKQNAEWYLALLYIKDSQIQRAIDLLNPISQDRYHLFARDAKGILVKLMSH